MKYSDTVSKKYIDNIENPRVKSLIKVFGGHLVKLATDNPDIIALDADRTVYVGMDLIKEKLPDQYINIGLAEQNMAGVATGLSCYGKIPVFSSLSAYNPGANLSQIRTAAQSGTHMIIVGTNYGLDSDEDGAVSQMLEDVSILRSMPGVTILSPADDTQVYGALEQAVALEGVVYIRLPKDHQPNIYDARSYKYDLQSADVLTEGDSAAIVATGTTVHIAMQAAKKLSDRDGINVTVINVHTLKPIDISTTVRMSLRSAKILVLDEHQRYGGLGSIMAELLAERSRKEFDLKIWGVNDRWPETGNLADVRQSSGLDVDTVIKNIKSLVK